MGGNGGYERETGRVNGGLTMADSGAGMVRHLQLAPYDGRL